MSAPIEISMLPEEGRGDPGQGEVLCLPRVTEPFE